MMGIVIIVGKTSTFCCPQIIDNLSHGNGRTSSVTICVAIHWVSWTKLVVWKILRPMRVEQTARTMHRSGCIRNLHGLKEGTLRPPVRNVKTNQKCKDYCHSQNTARVLFNHFNSIIDTTLIGFTLQKYEKSVLLPQLKYML